MKCLILAIASLTLIAAENDTIIDPPSQELNNMTTITTIASVNSTDDKTYCADNNLNHGEYGFGCNNFFYHCFEGRTYKVPCPENKYFAVESRRCEFKEWTPACGATFLDDLVNQSSKDDAYNAMITPDFCAKNFIPDGEYGEYSCNNLYYICKDGNTYKMKCIDNMYFNLETGACDHKEFIPYCGGTLIEQPSEVLRNSTTTTTTTTTMASIDSTDDETLCVYIPDGVYGYGCNNFYHICKNGNTYRMKCLDNMYFNVEAQVCDEKKFTPACGGTLRAPLTTNTPALNSTASSTSSTPSSSTSTSTVASTSSQTTQNVNFDDVQKSPRQEKTNIIHANVFVINTGKTDPTGVPSYVIFIPLTFSATFLSILTLAALLMWKFETKLQ